MWDGYGLGFVLQLWTYFVLFKGLKNASFLHAEAKDYLKHNIWAIMGVISIAGAVAALILRNKHEIIFRVIILFGTLGLAIAFAGNDLVNFIGPAVAAGQAVFVEGVELSGKVPTPSWALIVAGVLMILALNSSKKAKRVTETEIRLASGGGQEQAFKANPIGKAFVKLFTTVADIFLALVPASIKTWMGSRLVAPPLEEGQVRPPYDFLRASVNLIIASIIISIGTANKLPLSTTYITFMVAMGASLADGAWTRSTADARVSGMLTVLGGWILTGLIASCGAFIMASLFFLPHQVSPEYGSVVGLVLVAVLVLISLILSSRRHQDSSDELA